MLTNITKSVFTVLTLISCIQAQAQQLSLRNYPSNLFAVSVLHFDAVRAPHGPVYYLNSREGQAIIGAIGAANGIDPSIIMLAINAIPTNEINGENTNYRLPVATGYAYCGTRLRVISIVPTGGEHASLINVAVNPKELQMTTVTPRLGFTNGQSWAEGDVQVYGVLPQYQDEFIARGICKRVTEQIGILSCRGSQCAAGVTHGLDSLPASHNLSFGF